MVYLLGRIHHTYGRAVTIGEGEEQHKEDVPGIMTEETRDGWGGVVIAEQEEWDEYQPQRHQHVHNLWPTLRLQWCENVQCVRMYWGYNMSLYFFNITASKWHEWTNFPNVLPSIILRSSYALDKKKQRYGTHPHEEASSLTSNIVSNIEQEEGCNWLEVHLCKQMIITVGYYQLYNTLQHFTLKQSSRVNGNE